MAIVFNKVARKSPKDKSVKYYITPKTIKLVGLRDIAKLVAENTTMSPQEVELVLNSFVNKLQETLLNSYRGGSAFYGCTGLTSINIPNSVTHIGSCAFEYCI